MKRCLIKIIFLTLGVMIPFQASVYASGSIPVSEKDVEIRIALLNDVDEFSIRVRGNFKIIDPTTNQVLGQARRMRKTKVQIEENGIRLGQDLYKSQWIRFLLDKDIAVSSKRETKRYRGKVDIRINEKGGLLVINRLDLEHYIAGVLYHEASHRWPMQGLKAQAVAARTYALYQIKDNEEFPFDVRSDIYSQVYGGRSAERYRTNLAVKQTMGEVMLYKGEVLPAYYHATCAGMTEDVQNLWKHKSITPLQGHHCNFCVRSPHYRWKKNLRLKTIQDKLNKHGHDLWLIKDVVVLSRTRSGRINQMKIVDRKGKSITIAGKDFRHIVGPNIIKSNYYNITMQGYFIDLVGKGWGHGVGMCQWGAYFMARKQKSYDQILQFYYAGVELKDYRELTSY